MSAHMLLLLMYQFEFFNENVWNKTMWLVGAEEYLSFEFSGDSWVRFLAMLIVVVLMPALLVLVSLHLNVYVCACLWFVCMCKCVNARVCVCMCVWVPRPVV